MDLFQSPPINNDFGRPLADNLRPNTFDAFYGQEHFMGKTSPLLRSLLEQNHLWNLILWGPPGSGKTTFALLLSKYIKAHFLNVNAVDTGVKSLRNIAQDAKRRKLELRQRTVLFVDEIHRFNRSQQDVLLPPCENGDFILVGATTENPSYEITAALLSRCQILEFKSLSQKNLSSILDQAFDFFGISKNESLTAEAQLHICKMAAGDARKLINFIESLGLSDRSKDKNLQLDRKQPLDVAQVVQKLGFNCINYDKLGDEHYNCISAFIKSLRGSDVDAGLYYLARMIEGGEDPKFICRRLIVFASEDIGNADPRALLMAVAGLEAVKCIGLPEARINLAQITTYFACAPKSNRSYLGINKAQQAVKSEGALPIPKHLRVGNSQALRDLGHGVGYVYTQNKDRGWEKQSYLPDKLQEEIFYVPSERGFEKNMGRYQEWVKQCQKKGQA